MAKRWIRKAIKHPGRVRREAKRMGLIHGSQELTVEDDKRVAAHAHRTGDYGLERAAVLAERLHGYSRKGGDDSHRRGDPPRRRRRKRTSEFGGMGMDFGGNFDF